MTNRIKVFVLLVWMVGICGCRKVNRFSNVEMAMLVSPDNPGQNEGGIGNAEPYIDAGDAAEDGTVVVESELESEPNTPENEDTPVPEAGCTSLGIAKKAADIIPRLASFLLSWYSSGLNQLELQPESVTPEELLAYTQSLTRTAQIDEILQVVANIEDSKRRGATTRALQYGGMDALSLPLYMMVSELHIIQRDQRAQQAFEKGLISSCLVRAVKIIQPQSASPSHYIDALKEKLDHSAIHFDLVIITGPFALAAAISTLPYITTSTIVHVDSVVSSTELDIFRTYFKIHSNTGETVLKKQKERTLVLNALAETAGTTVDYEDYLHEKYEHADVEKAEKHMGELEELVEKADTSDWIHDKADVLDTLGNCSGGILVEAHEFVSLYEKDNISLQERVSEIMAFCDKLHQDIEELVNPLLLNAIGLLKMTFEGLNSDPTHTAPKAGIIATEEQRKIMSQLLDGIINAAANLSISDQQKFLTCDTTEDSTCPLLSRERALTKKLEDCAAVDDENNIPTCTANVAAGFYFELLVY